MPRFTLRCLFLLQFWVLLWVLFWALFCSTGWQGAVLGAVLGPVCLGPTILNTQHFLWSQRCYLGYAVFVDELKLNVTYPLLNWFTPFLVWPMGCCSIFRISLALCWSSRIGRFKGGRKSWILSLWIFPDDNCLPKHKESKSRKSQVKKHLICISLCVLGLDTTCGIHQTGDNSAWIMTAKPRLKIGWQVGKI